MKKIKILGILICVLCLTGCDFNYDLEISKEGITEVNTAWFNSNEIIDNDITNTVKEISNKYFINDDHLIANKTNIVVSDNKQGYQTINTHKLNEINNLKSLNLCYDNIKVINNEYKIGIKTTNQFLCFDYYDELENVTIHISSEFKCLECNADEQIGNDYYWYINSSNANDKKITAIFKNNSNYSKYSVLIICTIIVFIGIIVAVIITNRQRKNNNI